MDPAKVCDLCGMSAFEPLSQRDRKGRPLSTVVCRTCGLVAHEDIPTPAQLASYYAEHYRQEYHGQVTPSPHRVVREWNRGRALVARLQAAMAPCARVLEIGSGIGCTVMNFSLAGYAASGIEPGAGFCNFSRSRLHAQVRQCTLEELPPIAQYDLVLLVHVLEHLPSPTDALQRIARLLRPGGRLYVEVPNFNAPHAAPGQQFHFAHIYNFTPATLRMLAAKTGYRIQQAYSASRDKVIAFLLSKSATAALQIERTSYAQTLEATRRYSRLSYYVRAGYVCERLLLGVQRAGERLKARRDMETILTQCQAYAQTAPPAISYVRRAA